MDCLGWVAKYIIYFFNMIFLLCGVLLISFGSYVLHKMGDFKNYEEAVNTQTIPVVVIVLGCIIAVISFFGCTGAANENYCCILVYAWCVIIMLLMHIVIVIAALVTYQNSFNDVKNYVNFAFNNNNEANDYPMDFIQKHLECCGIKDYKDWNSAVPESCCDQKPGTCKPALYENRKGCEEAVLDLWSRSTSIMLYICYAGLVVELTCIILACYLASIFRHPSRLQAISSDD